MWQVLFSHFVKIQTSHSPKDYNLRMSPHFAENVAFFFNLIDLMDYCSRSFLNIVLWDYRHPSWFIWNFIASKCEENNFWTFSILLFSIFNNFNVEPKPIIAPVIHQFGLRGIFAKLSTWWARWIWHFSSGFVKFRQFSLVRQNVRICPDGIKRT